MSHQEHFFLEYMPTVLTSLKFPVTTTQPDINVFHTSQTSTKRSLKTFIEDFLQTGTNVKCLCSDWKARRQVISSKSIFLCVQ